MRPDETSVPARSATRATYAVFIVAGLAFASWASRIPAVRDQLGVDPGQLGLLLLAMAVGSISGMPLAGLVIGRWGTARTVAVASAVVALSLVTVGVGSEIGVGVVVVGLYGTGIGIGTWDIAMNVHGAEVEQRVGWSIMPRFHAGYSLGTVAGAGLGALAIKVGLPVPVHLALAAGLLLAVVPWATRAFLPGVQDDLGPQGGEPKGSVLHAWRERRTLMIGVFLLAFAFAEGAGNDWVSVALIDGYDLGSATAATGFTVFLAAMTVARWYGHYALDRYGRVLTVRVLGVVAIVGVVAFVFGPQSAPWVALVGAGLWGAGVSLGFPVAMSAGADDPRRAAARVSVVSAMGYCAFLAGPPLIGLVGDQAGVLQALTLVMVLLGVSLLFSGAVRPLGPEVSRPGSGSPG